MRRDTQTSIVEPPLEHMADRLVREAPPIFVAGHGATALARRRALQLFEQARMQRYRSLVASLRAFLPNNKQLISDVNIRPYEPGNFGTPQARVQHQKYDPAVPKP